MTTNFRTPQNMDDWMRSMEKRMQRQERRQAPAAQGTTTGSGETVLILPPPDQPERVWEWNDRHTIIVPGTQTKRLSHVPTDEGLLAFWHPGGHGGLPMINENFSVAGRFVTIPDPGFFALADTFSFQYEYVLEDLAAPDPGLIGYTTPGAFDDPTNEHSFALPATTAEGNLLVMAYRGGVAPGGGELIDDVICPDGRMTLVQRAVIFNGSQVVVEAVWVGIEDGSGDPIIVNVVNPRFPSSSGHGVLASFDGINGFGDVEYIESGSTTPRVAGTGAVAVVWVRGASFTTVNAAPPSGYTNVAGTGFDYSSIDISWWADPAGPLSPAGSFGGEGCCVIAIV